jgi:nucleotide-binding universal stress UspA family protein
MGSVAENAVRDVGRPVLVARSKSGQATLEKPARLLCAVDFSAASKQALRVALAVTTAFNAELTVLHVAEKAETDIAGIHRRLVDWIHPELGGQMEVTGEIRKGEAAETIVRLASEIGAYLLVVGASPRPFFESRTLGTTAVRVIRHSRVPVLTVPETES